MMLDGVQRGGGLGQRLFLGRSARAYGISRPRSARARLSYPAQGGAGVDFRHQIRAGALYDRVLMASIT
jgi:hypothetical protein